jgi:HEAT repeat protein
MPEREPPGSAEARVAALRAAHDEYLRALRLVLDLGPLAVPALVDALADKHACPIAEALGRLINLPAAAAAIPRLLDWIIGQWPVREEAMEALRLAGPRVLAPLLPRLRDAARDGDVEAVSSFLELAFQLPESTFDEIVPELIALLAHREAEIRSMACYTLKRIGLPHGRPALAALRPLVQDEKPVVRTHARAALLALGESE